MLSIVNSLDFGGILDSGFLSEVECKKSIIHFLLDLSLEKNIL